MGSISENIAYGNPHYSQDAIRSAAEAAYAMEFISQLEGGLDTQVGDDAPCYQEDSASDWRLRGRSEKFANSNSG